MTPRFFPDRPDRFRPRGTTRPLPQFSFEPPSLMAHLPTNGRILFYPSSCLYSPQLSPAPYDAVLLSSYSNESMQHENVFSVCVDNNVALGFLRQRGIKVETIVLFRDGCREGGNYECCIGDAFLSKLLTVTTDRFFLFCDGHRSSSIKRLPVKRKKVHDIPEYVRRLAECSNPIDDVRGYECTKMAESVRRLRIGNIDVSMVRGSAWNHTQDVDILFLSSYSKHATRRFLMEAEPAGIRYLKTSPTKSIIDCLQTADSEKRNAIGFIPFAHRMYERVISELAAWDKPFPQRVVFFHLHRNDYRTIYSHIE